MTKGIYYGGGRQKLPPELKAKNRTFKLYDWEVEKVKNFIKSLRQKKEPWFFRALHYLIYRVGIYL